VAQGFFKKWWAVPQTTHEEMKLIIIPHIIRTTVTSSTIGAASLV
jgi:hypothetical protein